jgi:hypothetical protein
MRANHAVFDPIFIQYIIIMETQTFVLLVLFVIGRVKDQLCFRVSRSAAPTFSAALLPKVVGLATGASCCRMAQKTSQAHGCSAESNKHTVCSAESNKHRCFAKANLAHGSS